MQKLLRRVFPSTIQERDRQSSRGRWIQLLVIFGALGMLGLGGLAVAKPVYRAISTWRAYSYLESSQSALNRKDVRTAVADAVAAYKLRPNNPKVVRALAALATRTRMKESAFFWGRLRDLAPFEEQDQLLYIRSLENDGEPKKAEQELLQWMNAHDRGTDLLAFAAEFYQRRRNLPRALAFLKEAMAQRPNDIQLALQHSILSVEAGSAAESRAGISLLWGIAESPDTEGRNALSYLHSKGLKSIEASQQFLDLVQKNPTVQEADNWVALDRQLEIEPWNRELVLEEARQKIQALPPARRLPFFEWLLQRREFAVIIELIPAADLKEHPAFLEPLMLALEGLGRRQEALQLIEQPVTGLSAAQMHILRAYAVSGQANQDNEELTQVLQRGVELARLEQRPDLVLKFASIGRMYNLSWFAQKTLEAARANPATARPALVALLEINRSANNEEEMLRLLREGFWQWSLDPALMEQAVHIYLLTGTEMENAAEHSLRLLKEVPGDPVRQVLRAFALAREGQAKKGAELVQKTDARVLSPSFRALYAYILFKSGQEEAAKKVAGLVPRALLLPSEAALLEKWH